ncbi:box C/D snoRNA protein 1 [Drosophila grimshawi]|uniref:Box C/D snoRNA protein 1 n=1 Tax=Drosophila grimshawi TaxID=7222 RepID=B4JNJ1_DROGR|nr:box C/D snoRNA protein 1 [Drosophila grimshawi]EDV92284.1 GH24828 [Drosophila grimshawi]
MTDINVTTNSRRLGNCEVCATTAARYACPKCEVKTCSVACVQIHKRELNCDGQRDRTKFMPLSKMTERDFMSDYCFLEECTRYAAQRKRDYCKRYTHQQRQLLPLHRLRSAALRRGTRLRLLLANFSRHKENTTYLNWKEQRIHWHIEWLFVGPMMEPLRYVDTRCDEQQTLATLLHKYLDKAGAERKVLRNHQIAGIGQLSLWLRAEGVRRSGTRCYPLMAHKTLCDNLAGKTIVEYPAIYVSYDQSPPAGYDIVDSDDEFDAISNQQTKSDNTSQQPAAKKSKAAQVTKEELLPEAHDVYELAASFGADDDPNGTADSSSSSDDDGRQ